MKALKIASLMVLAFVFGCCGLSGVFNTVEWLDEPEAE